MGLALIGISFVRAGETLRDGGGGVIRSGAGLSISPKNGRDSIDGLSRFQVAPRAEETGVPGREIARGVCLRLLRMFRGLTFSARRGS